MRKRSKNRIQGTMLCCPKCKSRDIYVVNHKIHCRNCGETSPIYKKEGEV